MAEHHPWIVLLGGHELNAGLIGVARRRRAKLLVVDWNERPAVTGDLHLRLDMKDSGTVLAALAPYVRNLLFAYTSSDAATETAASINAAHGLLRPAPGALRTARNKPAMNAAWIRAGVSSKRFRACRAAADAVAFHRAGASDSIVKPAAGSSSRGVTVIRGEDPDDQLEQAWARANQVDPHGEAIIEEYIHGSEFTAEIIGDSAGNVQVLAISRKHHSPNAGRGRVANKLHYNAPEIPDVLYRRIAGFARRCYRALGLHTSLGHFELIAQPDGRLVPLELGARSSGFIATHLVDAISGHEGTLLDAYERVLRGGRVPNSRLVPQRSAMYFFYDFPDGVGRRSDTNLLQFTPPGIASLASGRSNLVPGRSFAQIDAEPERPGFEVLVGDRESLTIEAVRSAEVAHRREFLMPGS